MTHQSHTPSSAKKKPPAPKEQYFYAYQYSRHGQWFSSLLYPTPGEALKGVTDSAIVHKKLYWIVL